MKVLIIRDKRYLLHDMGPFHPESPRRLETIYRYLEDLKGPFEYAEGELTKEEELLTIHDPQYVKYIASTRGKYVQLDPDTSTCPHTYEVALLAVGGLLKAIDGVLSGGFSSAFALIRPPGHHAENNRAMGFCFFNNVAIGAKYAQRKFGLKRVLIVDWDLHHGNGTQKAFWTDPSVLYFSVHQYPYYPGTGHFQEIGAGEGKGFTVNCPLRVGHDDLDYANIFRHHLKPIALSFSPQLILVSAGFDPYFRDPLGGMKITEKGFARLCDILVNISERTQAPLVFALEGGYHPEGLAKSVIEVLKRLGGELRFDRKQCEEEEDKAFSRVAPLLSTFQEVLKPYWDFEGTD